MKTLRIKFNDGILSFIFADLDFFGTVDPVQILIWFKPANSIRDVPADSVFEILNIARLIYIEYEDLGRLARDVSMDPYRPLHQADEMYILHPAAKNQLAELRTDRLGSAQARKLLGDDCKVLAKKRQPADFLELGCGIERPVYQPESLIIDFQPEPFELIHIVERDAIGIVFVLRIEHNDSRAISYQLDRLDGLAGSGLANDQFYVGFVHQFCFDFSSMSRHTGQFIFATSSENIQASPAGTACNA